MIDVIAYDGFDATRIKVKLEEALKQSGLTHPNITLEQVKTLTRHQETGKLRRFIPLTS